ncbi:uncharacterized protein MKK02DRAFT_29179 [Dioszegia hungarica]|uniref:Uncharacterized protein n=1 Tax=Dioszegia hungarica TaxID=4972 RepID=A0AA38LSH2_9TREE|nr:uncharacterized protein MKK02DRAFT_29179 [Dioszegia hungarica]KAI9633328.1 hypothetical protein MKK02DRAFT_29179 [Dioszegia hungarica]
MSPNHPDSDSTFSALDEHKYRTGVARSVVVDQEKMTPFHLSALGTGPLVVSLAIRQTADDDSDGSSFLIGIDFIKVPNSQQEAAQEMMQLAIDQCPKSSSELEDFLQDTHTAATFKDLIEAGYEDDLTGLQADERPTWTLSDGQSAATSKACQVGAADSVALLAWCRARGAAFTWDESVLSLGTDEDDPSASREFRVRVPCPMSALVQSMKGTLLVVHEGGAEAGATDDNVAVKEEVSA